MKQHTLKRAYKFSGKGLHSGIHNTITLIPAAPNHGIRFLRTDLGEDAFVSASIANVYPSSRNTSLREGDAVVMTCEHLLSAMCGLGVDNRLVKMDAPEVPILDGSARPYIEAILADGLHEQDAERRYISVTEPLIYKDDKSDGEIAFYPSDKLEIYLTTDFGSKVLGVQRSHYSDNTDYAAEIAPCRTFCFFHELEYLVSQGLVQGGDMDNAIVIVEHPASDEAVSRMSRHFGVEGLTITSEGYLNNLKLNFPDECGRHKMLDLIGDLYLAGAPIKGHIEAYKTGHRLNAEALKSLLNKIYYG